MDNKKKIIVGVVGLVLAGSLIFILLGMASGSDEKEMNSGLEFDSPMVNEEEFDSSTKKQLYDKDEFEYDAERYDSMADNLSFLQKMKQKLNPEKEFDEEEYLEKEEDDEEIDDVNAQLQMLMALQNDMNTQPTIAYNQAAAPVVQEEIPVKKVPKEGNYFFGAASDGKKAGENLIPAEVIDQGFQKQGTTIAIRTKQEILIPERNIKIPKNAVIYGVVNIQDTRLIININKYKRDNKLYTIDLDVHDYDGQLGIHLNNRTIFRIPSNVTKDVYNAAIKRYSQQAGALSGGGNDLNGKDIGNLAAISAAKEVSKEIFDRRRVFIPRKYHLWLTVNQTTNGK